MTSYKFYQTQNIQQSFISMDRLLNSRLDRQESPTKLENLSPEKYGKGAYAALTYTPSKLVDNILYREVTTMKKIEEESSKVRNSEAFNSLLKDRLGQLQEEKEGIEQTLTQQITMYKKILGQNEIKHEQRLNEIQRVFNEEMQHLILAKQEEVKYAQSEKEILEDRIAQLEREVNDYKDSLANQGGNLDQLTKNHQKLEIQHQHLSQKLQDTQKRAKQNAQQAKTEYEELSRKLFNTEVQFRSQLQKQQLQKQKQKQNLERLHRSQLQKVQNKRMHEAMVKNQQLKDLVSAFEGEANRLKDIINNKENSIDNLNAVIQDEKEKYVELARGTTEEITNLVHQRSRLKDEIDYLNVSLAKEKQSREDQDLHSQKEIAKRDQAINKLKKQLELNQVNYMRDQDKSNAIISEIHNEVLIIRSENQRLSFIGNEHQVLCRQIRNLKDLLLESSLEMERCKDEFIRIGREKDLLSVKVRELGYENESLHRLRVQREEQARGWRESYFISKGR